MGMTETMNILVLGGNGYLGSKVVRRLVNEGHTVVCTKRKNSDLGRLSDLSGRILWIPAAVDAIDAVIRFVKFDYSLNLACNYGRNTVLYDNVIESNIEFPLKTLNELVMAGTKNFLTIGTGLPDDLNMYSFSKKTFSEFGKFYAEKHGINFFELRLEMLYGADEPEDRFLPSVIGRMIAGEDVDTTVGTQRRDIISAEDAVKAIFLVMNSDIRGFREIPVGTGIAPTISEILDFIWEKTGRRSRLNKGAIPLRPNEPDCAADTGFLRTLGEWKPVFWQDGLLQMIKEKQKKEKDRYENPD